MSRGAEAAAHGSQWSTDGSPTGHDCGRVSRGGFTLVELVVVMGLLAAFVLMLVQLLGSGVEMFQKGQRSQDLADRAQLATRAVDEVFGSMIGPPEYAFEPQDPAARLLVTWENLGFPPEDGQPHQRVQVVRSTVALSDVEESRLLEELFRPIAEEEGGDLEQIEERVVEMLAAAPRRERGDLLLMPWPADDRGVFLELRRGLFAQYDELAVMDVREFGGEDFPAELALAVTEPIVGGLLHFEVALWSRDTTAWTREPGTGGPEYAWDSAREGWLAAEEVQQVPRRETFGLDLGPSSLRDPRDDTFPRWARITLVVAAREPAPEAILAGEISASDREIRFNRVDRLPADASSRWLKIGPEWVRYAEIRGRTASGVKRGLRGTLARDHASGEAVRAGRTVVVYVRLPHGRDGGEF